MVLNDCGEGTTVTSHVYLQRVHLAFQLFAGPGYCGVLYVGDIFQIKLLSLH